MLRQVDPAELSPGEFASTVLAEARQPGQSIIVIDSLNGYLNAMPEERFLVTQLHELLTSLGQLGIATILVGVQHGLVGSTLENPIDASYLADTVMQLRYFEIAGRGPPGDLRHQEARRQARADHPRAPLCQAGGIRLGEPLREYRGILTGVPVLAARDPDVRLPEP